MEAVSLLEAVRGGVDEADRDVLVHEEEHRGHERRHEGGPARLVVVHQLVGLVLGDQCGLYIRCIIHRWVTIVSTWPGATHPDGEVEDVDEPGPAQRGGEGVRDEERGERGALGLGERGDVAAHQHACFSIGRSVRFGGQCDMCGVGVFNQP